MVHNWLMSYLGPPVDYKMQYYNAASSEEQKRIRKSLSVVYRKQNEKNCFQKHDTKPAEPTILGRMAPKE